MSERHVGKNWTHSIGRTGMSRPSPTRGAR
jgi:hypothetical protein